jgi:RNA polymerase sigma factor (sigma-70 family)
MKFEEVLKDEDCVSIMTSIAKRYKAFISKDEIKSFKLEAAWEACEKYDPNHPSKMKFTTFLGNCLKFKILLYIRSQKIKAIKPMKDVADSRQYTGIIDMLDCLTQPEKELFEQKYIYNYSVQEIADKNNISRQSMKNRLNKIKQKIASYYQITS